jgi:hypothetical protein
MKNSTHPVKRFFLVSVFFLFFVTAFGQNALVGSDFSTGWGGSCPNPSNSGFNYLSAGAGGTYGATKSVATIGLKYFRFGVDWSGVTSQLTITPGTDVDVTPNTTYSLNTSCTTNGAMKYNVPNASYNYVFKTLDAGTNPTGTFVFFEVQGAVRTVTAVTQSPLATSVPECHPATITATLDGALSAGQAVYLRYTKDSYANSTVVKLTGSGTTYSAKIPFSFNATGTNVSYYVFTSGDSNVASNGSNADLYTINLNNSGGSNYSYTVVAGGATTAIPDPKFEQALIDLGLDCTIDGKVFSSNISDVTVLDIEDKNISSLIGIKDFTNLTMLVCKNKDAVAGNDNAITDLDVSNMTQLKFLYCDNNIINNLNISGLTSLKELTTSNNPLSTPTLDLHGSPNLYYLFCEYNGLTNINISGLTNLDAFGMMGNSITTLNLSNNPNITYLDCDDNAFTSLDVSALTKLQQFYCSGNQLTNLDVRGLTNLDRFYCSNNPLTCILVDDVAAAVLKTTTADPDPQGDGSFLWATDNVSLYSYCNCTLTTTWDGSSWDKGAPTTGTYAAIISGNYNVPANINACTLTVTNNAIVTIPSGYNVTLNAPIVVDPGSSFTLSNNANLIQTNRKSVNSGNINVKRDSSPLFRFDYTLWSSPVANQNLAAFSPLTSLAPYNRFYIYDSASDKYTNTVPVTLDPTTTNFTPGAGYLIRMPNIADAVTPTTFPGVFTGVPNNGDIPFTLSTAGGGYNLVGNPYASPIAMATLVADNSAAISTTMYFWRKTNGTGTAYCTYNTTGSVFASNGNTQSVNPAGIIQTGQGFFVQAIAPGSLVFKNGQRAANTTGQFFKTKQVAAASRVWLNATNIAGDFSQMAVNYTDGATQGVDDFDGKYINDSAFALTSNINGGEYTIQGRPAFDASDVVPLNFKTDVAGNYTIAIDHSDGLFATGQDVYLVDSTTGTETNLKTTAYTFTATAGVANTRFSLKYQKSLKVDTPVFNDDSVVVYKNKGTLYVNSGAVSIANIKVYDVQGRLIAEQKDVKANTATINNLKAIHQVLIVKVTSEDDKVVSKKVVN